MWKFLQPILTFYCKITYLPPIWACNIFNLYLPIGRNFFTYFGFFSVYPISIYRYWLSRGALCQGALGVCLSGWLGRYGPAPSDPWPPSFPPCKFSRHAYDRASPGFKVTNRLCKTVMIHYLITNSWYY